VIIHYVKWIAKHVILPENVSKSKVLFPNC
jgi:hypothetical protein